MRTFLRLMGTSDEAADRALDAMSRITEADIRDFAFGAFVFAVAIIDVALYAYIIGGVK